MCVCVCSKYYAMLKAPLIAEMGKTVVGTWGKQHPTGTGFQHVDGVEKIWNLGVGRMHWNCGSRWKQKLGQQIQGRDGIWGCKYVKNGAGEQILIDFLLIYDDKW